MSVKAESESWGYKENAVNMCGAIASTMGRIIDYSSLTVCWSQSGIVLQILDLVWPLPVATGRAERVLISDSQTASRLRYVTTVLASDDL